MTQIPITPNRSRLPGIPGTQIGGTVNANDMGSGNARQYGQLAGAIGGVADFMNALDIKQAKAEFRVANSDYMKKIGEEENRILSSRGSAANNSRKDMEEAHRVHGEAILQSMKNNRAKEMFKEGKYLFDNQSLQRADDHVVKETERSNLIGIDSNNNDYIKQIGQYPEDNKMFAGNVALIKANVAEKYHGYPPSFIENEQRKLVMLATERRADALAGLKGPDAALAFLNMGVDSEFHSPEQQVSKDGEDVAAEPSKDSASSGETGSQEKASEPFDLQMHALKKKYLGMVQKDAKRQSANRGREIGIRLGEDPNIRTPIDIERALYGYDKEIADIARIEGTRILNVRIAAGELDPFENRSEVIDGIAATATNRADIARMIRDIPNLTPKERKELEAEAVTVFNSYESDRKDAAKEARETEKEARADAKEAAKEAAAVAKAETENFEAETVRVKADAIAKKAGSVYEIQRITDYMAGVTEKQRKAIYEVAVVRFNTRQTHEAKERAEQENEAMRTMEQAGWDVGAISPEWSGDLQRKMEGLANKNRKADPVVALEYCEMPAEQLKQMVRDGQWPDMSIALGGENSEEYKYVWKKAFTQSGEFKELRTPLQYGRDEFLRRTSINPNTAQGRQSYSEFIPLYENALRERAMELGLGDVGKVPREDQNAALKTLLEKGKYVDGAWTWVKSVFGGSEAHAYQVMNDPDRSMSNFTPYQSPVGVTSSNPALSRSSNAAGQGNRLLSKEELPEFAAPFALNGDKERAVISNNLVRIVDKNGIIWLHSPGRKPRQARPITSSEEVDADDAPILGRGVYPSQLAEMYDNMVQQ